MKQEMFEEDENDLAIFNFYNKLPFDEKRRCEVFLTPENIFGVREASSDDINRLARTIHYLRELPSKKISEELVKHRYGEIGERWHEFDVFKIIVKYIKEYYQLRPNVLDDYPECLL